MNTMTEKEKEIFGEEFISIMSATEDLLSWINKLEEGTNIMVDTGQSVYLMKHEGFGLELLGYSSARGNRHTTIMLSNIILGNPEHLTQNLMLNFFATHKMEFRLDEEFQLFLPSSESRDLFLPIAFRKWKGKEIIKNEIPFITADSKLIEKRLKAITRPLYFKDVVEPFLGGIPTKFRMPHWKRHFLPFNLTHMLKRYCKVVKDLDSGDFVYVGTKDEVYLLSVAKDIDGEPYMQGTYTTSAKPPLYFSNNYLDFVYGHIERHFTPASFGTKPFIFPQMGRSQNCKNTVFTGEPDIITGNITEALVHFRTTDFAEFEDIVKAYYNKIGTIHSSSGKPNGLFYY